MTKQELNCRLINHYQCFNSERFYLDEYNEKYKYVSIVTSSISDPCPVQLCKSIARYVQKLCTGSLTYVYVGAWAFKGSSLL